MAESPNTRVTRLEGLVAVLAESQAKLDDVLVLLTEAQIRTEQRFQETDERFRKTDQRIETLVSAIGQMLRRQNGKS